MAERERTRTVDRTRTLEDLERGYRERTKESLALHERAKASLPGGDTRSVTYTRPYPTYIERAKGTRLTTVDGEELVDFLNNYTQAIHGHALDEINEAISAAVRRGNGVGSPTEDVLELSERLVDRFPSIDRIRLANSGTEGTMNAVRAALAHTGKEGVLKVLGGYHGTHDAAEVGVSGEGRENAGIPIETEKQVRTVAYNDPEALKAAFERHGDELACFILEPVMGAGGVVPATDEYLRAARDLTESHDALLIFDEVITSRLSVGGVQERRGVLPDLTALGKYIGGVLPIGAFGGREDVMDVFHPEDGTVHHSGTFNGNPATMAGGVVTLDRLDGAAIDRINRMGEEIRDRTAALGEDSDLPVQVTGEGSLFNVHFTDGPVTDFASSGAGPEGDEDLARAFYLSMREAGVFMAPRGMGNVSTAMTDEEVDGFVDAFEHSLATVEALSG
jgi:glutamate-1-semialdehyde 2,1-aminomutase